MVQHELANLELVKCPKENQCQSHIFLWGRAHGRLYIPKNKNVQKTLLNIWLNVEINKINLL